MYIFEVVRIIEFDELFVKQPVSKLKRDGKCLFDDFVETIKKDKNLEPELDDLTALIEGAANNKEHPKFKKLKTKKIQGYPIFEAKSNSLRLYVTREQNTGIIIILGGSKKNQDKDIAKTETIVSQYKNSKS